MVEQITVPVGFVSKPTVVRGGRAAMCVLRLASAKELRQKATDTSNKSDSDAPTSPTTSAEKSKDLKQQWHFIKVLEYERYNKRGSKKWTTGCALISEQMDVDWIGSSKLFDSVSSDFRVSWLSESVWFTVFVSDWPTCGTGASFDDVCVRCFLSGLWPLRRDARERFVRGGFWNV